MVQENVSLELVSLENKAGFPNSDLDVIKINNDMLSRYKGIVEIASDQKARDDVLHAETVIDVVTQSHILHCTP